MNVTGIGLAGGFLLLIIGLYCLASKGNMIKLVLAAEIMTNGAIVILVTFASTPVGLDPVIVGLAILAVGVGGCIAAIGLAIAIHAFRHYKTLDVRELKRLRW